MLINQSKVFLINKGLVNVAINQLLQSKIKEYNEEKGTDFENVHNCKSYIGEDDIVPGSESFCSAVWPWSVSVWKKTRLLEAEIIDGSMENPPETVEEFLSLLPDFDSKSYF